MSSAARVAGFLVALGAAFLVALGIGRAVGPVSATTSTHADDPAGTRDAGHADDTGLAEPPGDQTEPAQSPATTPGGLAISQDGYTLELAARTLPPGQGVPLSFRVVGPDGRPVTGYDVEHERELHLIVVRRDQVGFQHVHPTRSADGTWTTELDLTSGTWRVFADFTPRGGDGLTLGADLVVPGRSVPVGTSEEARTAEVDGYTVSFSGDLVPGTDSEVTLSVSRDGRPVTDLQPYLGAYGHLVALRDGDLAYLHVHPHESRTAGPAITFEAAVPSRGGYHLYLDFKHEGRVRTAVFAVPAGSHGDTAPRDEPTEEGDHGHAE